jgi:hypothetical protein
MLDGGGVAGRKRWKDVDVDSSVVDSVQSGYLAEVDAGYYFTYRSSLVDWHYQTTVWWK